MLRTGVRGWEAADLQADRQDALRVGWPFLHQTLESARPERTPDANKLRFDGDAHSLSWVAELPAHFATGGPRLLTLAAAEDPGQGRRRLVLTSAPLAAEATAGDAQRAVLVDDLADVEIRYYGAGDDGTPGWQTNWQEQRTLPQLVQIDIRPADGPAWPALYAHPYLAGPPPTGQDDTVLIPTEDDN